MKRESFTCLVFAFLLLPTLPSMAGEMVEVRIETVLASNASREIDQRLGQIKQPLERLFRYSSYRLVQGERRKTKWGSPVSFNLPGGRYLQIVPKGYENNRVSMRVVLIEGDKPIVDTDLVLQNGGFFFMGGRRHQEGVLITSIYAAAEE